MTKKFRIISMFVVIIALASLIAAIYFGLEVKKLKNGGNSASAITALEISKTVEEVGKYIVLPENETPTMATVSDPSQLLGQPFFANAEVGDVVLIYTTSRKAILWRPSTKQIIEVSPINMPVQATSTLNTSN